MTVDVYVHPDTVDITFGGLDRFLCLQDRLIVPMDEIVSARVRQIEALSDERGWPVLGVLGGYLPGVSISGRWHTRNRWRERQLWCVYRDPEVLVIETTSERRSKIVLQHPDRHNLAWLIGERIMPAV